MLGESRSSSGLHLGLGEIFVVRRFGKTVWWSAGALETISRAGLFRATQPIGTIMNARL
jgi:hypothetical protein